MRTLLAARKASLASAVEVFEATNDPASALKELFNAVHGVSLFVDFRALEQLLTRRAERSGSDFARAVTGLCTWRETPQGKQFWLDAYQAGKMTPRVFRAVQVIQALYLSGRATSDRDPPHPKLPPLPDSLCFPDLSGLGAAAFERSMAEAPGEYEIALEEAANAMWTAFDAFVAADVAADTAT